MRRKLFSLIAALVYQFVVGIILPNIADTVLPVT